MRTIQLFLIGTLLFLSGCLKGDMDDMYGTKRRPIKLFFSHKHLTATVGEDFKEPVLIGHRISDGRVRYTSTRPYVASVNSQTGDVRLIGSGEVEIIAEQAETKRYRSDRAKYRITVTDKKAVNLRFSKRWITVDNINETITEPTLSGHTVSSGEITYTSNNSAVATVNRTTGKITLKGSGRATIKATQAETLTYREGRAYYEINVMDHGRTGIKLRFSSNTVIAYKGETSITEPTLSGHTTSTGSIRYWSTNKYIATVNSSTGKVTLTGRIGHTSIMVMQAKTGKYAADIAAYQILVREKRGTQTDLTFKWKSTIAEVGNTNFVEPQLVGKNGSTGKITYTSSDTSIATVNADTGNITAFLKSGNVTITATIAETATHMSSSDSYNISVREKTSKQTDLTFKWKSTIAEVGNTNFVEPQLVGKNGSTGKITYTSSDTSIATVNADTGNITAFLKGGDVTITATIAKTSTHTSSSDSYDITVLKRAVYATLSNTDVTATLGSPFTEPTLSNAHTVSPGKITYASTDTSIVTVNENTGKVTLKKAGTAYIQITKASTPAYKGFVIAYRITVQAPAVKRNADIYFGTTNIIGRIGLGSFPTTPSVLGKNGSTGKVTYASSNTAIAKVDTNTGDITDMIQAGTVTITATIAATDTHKTGSASYKLEVLKQPVYLSVSASSINAIVGKSITPPTITGQITSSHKGMSAGAITYTSSQTAVVTVDSSTGSLTAVSEGTATITITQAATPWHMADAINYTVLVAANKAGCNGATTADIGGKSYKVVEIDGKCWMAEPLRLTSGFTDGQTTSRTANTPYFYKRQFMSASGYYTYYNWFAAVSLARMEDKKQSSSVPSSWGTKKIDGWHLPTNKEYTDAFGSKNLGTVENDDKVNFMDCRYINPYKVKIPLGGSYYVASSSGWRDGFLSLNVKGYLWTATNATAKIVDRSSNRLASAPSTDKETGFYILLVKD